MSATSKAECEIINDAVGNNNKKHAVKPHIIDSVNTSAGTIGEFPSGANKHKHKKKNNILPAIKPVHGKMGIIEHLDRLAFFEAPNVVPWKRGEEEIQVNELDMQRQRVEELLEHMRLDKQNSVILDPLVFVAANVEQEQPPVVEIPNRNPRGKFTPLSLEEKEEFWTQYNSPEAQKRRIERLKSVNCGAKQFNEDTAWDPNILWETHCAWVHNHNERIMDSEVRREMELFLYNRRIIENTTEYRRKVLKCKQVKAELILNQKNLLPKILAASALQMLIRRLQYEWHMRLMKVIFKKMIKKWRVKANITKSKNNAADIIVDWISVHNAHKTLLVRVNKGLRKYRRQVIVIQRLCRRKMDRRKARIEILNKLFLDCEKKDIEKSKCMKDKRKKKAGSSPTKPPKTTYSGTSAKATTKRKAQIIVHEPVSEEIRNEVILEYTKQEEARLIRCSQEYEVLYDRSGDLSRNQVKQIAIEDRRKSSIYGMLSKIPGSLEGFDKYPTFNMYDAPFGDMITSARKREQYLQNHQKDK